MSAPLLIIEGFDPLRLQLPAEMQLTDQVRVRLPPVHIRLLDLSMGGLIPDGPHIGMDAPMTELTITLAEPATVGNIFDAIAGNIDAWRDLWLASQEALDKCGPILG
jgi:hypothetical protein